MIWVQRGDPLFLAYQRFLSRRIWGDAREISGDTLLVVQSSGKVSAVIGFQNFNPEAGVMEISAAADDPKWLRRDVINEAFDYVFRQCGCQAAVLRCDADDKRMDKLAHGLGFKRHDVPRLRGRNNPEAIYVLGDDEYRAGRFYRGKSHEQETTSADAAA